MFIVNVEGAIYKGDKWLIGKRSDKEEHAAGELGLIGGKVEEEGFSSGILEKTVIREIHEEVGVEVSHPKYVHSASFITEQGIHVVNVIFICEYASGKPVAKDPDEISEVFWMTADAIINDENTADYLKDYIRRAEEMRLSRINAENPS